MRRLSIAFVVALVASFASAAEPPKFELKDGDRVVFLGNTLIEREQKYGYWELMLTMAWPERNVTFRNLGWSGDTVWGESRAGFGTQADGFKALKDQVTEAKPTVIFVGYGNVEAFDGEKGFPKFLDGFNNLLDALESTKARIVVLAPWPPLGVQDYSRNVTSYAQAIAELAERRNITFIGWDHQLRKHDDEFASAHYDGFQLNAFGYRILAKWLAAELGVPYSEPTDQHAKLIERIRKKNELFFHRWRPQNETYLFGFRKHEQGKNAKEVFEFDPLVAAEEKKIAELRVKLAAELKKAEGAK